MQNWIKYLSIGLILTFVKIANAQNDSIKPINVPLLGVDYGFNLPASDLKGHFKAFNSVGLSAGYKLASNWQFSLGGAALFGNKVNTLAPVKHILNEDSLINATNGTLAQYAILMRGLSIGLKVGKIITIDESNPNSGILLQLGAGFLQHKIRYEDLQSQVPQFQGDYVKLIDRLTGGIYINQAVGYQLFSNNRLVNFNVVFELTEGFTKSLRSYNLNAANPTDDSGRLDLFYTLKLTWMLPFYKKSTSSNTYYYE